MPPKVPTTYVLYPADSDDGFTAAWAIWRSLGESAVYLTEAPKTFPEGATVYAIDAPWETVWTQGKRFFSAESESAAHHAWNYFHRNRPSDLLLYIEDERLGWKRRPDCEAIIAWVRSWPHAFARWTEMAVEIGTDRGGVIREGEAILRAGAQAPRGA